MSSLKQIQANARSIACHCYRPSGPRVCCICALWTHTKNLAPTETLVHRLFTESFTHPSTRTQIPSNKKKGFARYIYCHSISVVQPTVNDCITTILTSITSFPMVSSANLCNISNALKSIKTLTCLAWTDSYSLSTKNWCLTVHCDAQIVTQLQKLQKFRRYTGQ